MTRSEWESLMQAFGGEAVRSDIDGLLRALVASQSSEPAGAVTRDAPGSSTGLAAEVRSVVVAPVAGTLEPLVQFSAPPVPTGAAPSTQETSDERSVASNVMQTIGIESICALAMPVTRFVAPGPEVASATPTSPLARA